MTRVPRKIGMASSGTPKATEWLTLYTVYMVLSTIPLLYNSTDPHQKLICNSIIQAAEITNLALSRTFSPEDGDTLASKLKIFRDNLQYHWPTVTVKPNFHIAQHLPQIATLFGPPTYTACWVGERMNGRLIKVPKNRHAGVFFAEIVSNTHIFLVQLTLYF